MVQDYEADESVLFKQLFIDRRKQLHIMFNNIDVSFRLHGSSGDTMIGCFLDELDILRVFLAENGTLSSKQTDTIVAHLRHCLLQDSVVQQVLLDMVEGDKCPATNEETSLHFT